MYLNVMFMVWPNMFLFCFICFPIIIVVANGLSAV